MLDLSSETLILVTILSSKNVRFELKDPDLVTILSSKNVRFELGDCDLVHACDICNI
jgi:hypothetical protein